MGRSLSVRGQRRGFYFLLVVLLGLIGANYASAQDAGEFDRFNYCRQGLGPGGGYDPNTQRYDWTCGNYNWSSRFGGFLWFGDNPVADYKTPTTPQGNSWIMECSGDGVGSPGNSYEQGACYEAGERVKMYSDADLILALDQVVPNGKVYMPRGIYHFGYCGRQPNGNPNGCPATRDHPYTMQRKWTTYGGRQVIGEGFDRDGPRDGPVGQKRTGTYFMSDHGSDLDADGDFSDNYGPVSLNHWQTVNGGPDLVNSYEGNHWAWHAGPKRDVGICDWDTDDQTGCTLDGFPFGSEDRIAKGSIARGSNLLLDDFEFYEGHQTNPAKICVEDRLSAAGVCSGNTLVRCTVDTETRLGYDTGGCPGDLGQCISLGDAVQARIDAGERMFAVFKYAPKDFVGDANVGDDTFSFAYAEVGSVQATACQTNGVEYDLGLPEAPGGYGDWGFTDLHDITQNNDVYFASQRELDNFEGGFSYATVHPQNYNGRAAANGNNDIACDYDNENATGSETDGAACDHLELINLSGGFRTKIHHVAAFYGGGGHTSSMYAFSQVDGDPACWYCSLEDSFISAGKGLATDASGWTFRRNVWSHWDSLGRPLMAVSFGGHARMIDETVEFSQYDHLFEGQNETGMIIRNMIIKSSDAAYGHFRTRKMRNFTVDGLTGEGNVGIPYYIEAPDDKDSWNLSFTNNFWENHQWSVGSYPMGAIVVGDYGGSTDFDGALNGFYNFRNIGFGISNNWGACALFFEGQSGDDVAGNTGLNRTVDDYRNHVRVDGFDLQVFDNGATGGKTYRGICFGDTGSGENDPEDAFVLSPSEVKGPMPAWTAVTVNGTRIPDNPVASVSAAEAGDCSDNAVMAGQTVLVHDLDGADCSETGGVLDSDSNDSTNEIAHCRCTAGVWGTP